MESNIQSLSTSKVEDDLLLRVDLGSSKQQKRRSSFAIACSVCGLVAFVQLLMMGVAVAMRVGETRVVERRVQAAAEKYYIPMLMESNDPKLRGSVKPRSLEDLMEKYGDGNIPAETVSIEKPRSMQRSFGLEIRPEAKSNNSRYLPIKNTQVERLIEDAMSLQRSGDIMRAILKLDEAETIDPEEPAITFRRAQLYEVMRNWEKAGDAYDTLFEMGPEIGDYYEIAADKIANGIQESPDNVPFQLGNLLERVSQDSLRADITVPIRRMVDKEVDPSQIEVRIFFYDIVDNKEIMPVPQQRERNISKRWITGVPDWAEPTESLEAIYQLPRMDVADVHLFGDRKYFGQVVELYYKGELMDQLATPGRLHGLHAQEQYKHQLQPQTSPYDLLPMDDTGEGLLLPALPE